MVEVEVAEEFRGGENHKDTKSTKREFKTFVLFVSLWF
jgi:hypothetical protein